MKNLIIALYVSIALSFVAGAQAGGEGSGIRGGGTFIYLNGVPQMADPFVKVNDHDHDGSEVKLSAETIKYLSAIQSLLMAYGVSSDEFWNNRVFGEKATYRMVATPADLPCQDVMEVDPEKLSGSTDYQVAQYACTRNAVTFIAKSEFENKPFKLQGLAILHERLHAFSGNYDHSRISPLVSTISRLIELKEKQAKGDGNEPLSEEELASWRLALYQFASELGFHVPDLSKTPIHIFKNGGGICISPATCVVDQASLIGVGSVIVGSKYFEGTGKTTISHSRVLGSRVLSDTWGSLTTISDSIVLDSAVEQSELFGATVSNSLLNSVKIRSGASVRHSTLGAYFDSFVVIDKNVQIDRLNLMTIWGGLSAGNELILSPISQELKFAPGVSCKVEFSTSIFSFGWYAFRSSHTVTSDGEEFLGICDKLSREPGGLY